MPLWIFRGNRHKALRTFTHPPIVFAPLATCPLGHGFRRIAAVNVSYRSMDRMQTGVSVRVAAFLKTPTDRGSPSQLLASRPVCPAPKSISGRPQQRRRRHGREQADHTGQRQVPRRSKTTSTPVRSQPRRRIFGTTALPQFSWASTARWLAYSRLPTP